jgi:lipase chaperone LimK
MTTNLSQQISGGRLVEAREISVNDDYVRVQGRHHAQRGLAVRYLADDLEVSFGIEQQTQAPAYFRLTFD